MPLQDTDPTPSFGGFGLTHALPAGGGSSESSSRPAAAQAVSALRTASPIRPRRACPPSQGRSGCRTTARSVCEASPTTRRDADLGQHWDRTVGCALPTLPTGSVHPCAQGTSPCESFASCSRSPSPQTSAGSLPRLPRLQALALCYYPANHRDLFRASLARARRLH